ncbi:para-aminobenzoate synthetase / 4-amino-4-deoxychorismate lyase [Desulfuromonas thiophila]|uniref:Para-aminobenzoate synthetase / 4-amino-4-deoxychorismate lyase n=2 Tax=Desulfuromonas thiophila TaxID=57664 RepID=A0A1G6YEX9_9BACT|nr:para-aminobenzoate synthetase / 4-amino-4-deoxychorismate lyase [Desulfuromonas thiophila]
MSVSMALGASLASAGPKVLLHCPRRRLWQFYVRPQQEIVAHSPTEVVAALQAVEQAVEGEGLHAAGFVGFEAGAAFSRAQPWQPRPLPLLWFGLFAPPQLLAQLPPPDGPDLGGCWLAQLDGAAHARQVARIRQLIAAGETYQVNLTYPYDCLLPTTPWTLFHQLQQGQPGGYAAYIDLGRFAICSASPELFFERAGSRILTRPMKGTAARGADTVADAAQRRLLAESVKDRAENLMIVDMLRNDLGRIARPGTVRVPRLFTLEAYPTLWQMTSSVTARTDASLAELFAALFPCASITGAPKENTLRHIARLEQAPRQIYTGAIGCCRPGRRGCFSVAIRTALVDRASGTASYGVGGGIVWDSAAAAEYRESQLKAAILPRRPSAVRLLETLRWSAGAGFHLLEGHLRRLLHSAACHGYPCTAKQLRQRLAAAAACQPRQGRYRVRLLLDSQGVIECQFLAEPQRAASRPLRLAWAAEPVQSTDATLRHKTEQRQRYDRLRQLAGPEADEVLLYNERDELTEATTANVLLRRAGRWLTPALQSGLLPGVQRQHWLEQGRIEEAIIRRHEIGPDTPLVLINALRGCRRGRLQPDRRELPDF